MAEVLLQGFRAGLSPSGPSARATALSDSIGKVRVSLLQGGDVGGAVDEYLSTLRSVVDYCTS